MCEGKSEELPSPGLRALELEDPAFLSDRALAGIDSQKHGLVLLGFLRVLHRHESLTRPHIICHLPSVSVILKERSIN